VSLSVQQRALRQAVHERMANAPQWGWILADCLGRMNRGEWCPEFVDAVLQKWERFDYDLYDAYCFVQVRTWVGTGALLCSRVPIGADPLPDQDRTGNNRILSQLGPPFAAQFGGGAADCDGYLQWDKPLELVTNLDDGSRKCQVVPPRSVPLEVGLTEGATTYWHLAQSRGLARWAYGSKDLYLFCVVEPAQGGAGGRIGT